MDSTALNALKLRYTGEKSWKGEMEEKELWIHAVSCFVSSDSPSKQKLKSEVKHVL